MPVTFQVVGNLADFGNDPRANVKVRATATPRIKVGDTAIHSNEPEQVVTDSEGAFTLELVSLPGVWYRITTPYAGQINTVNLAGYVPDVLDPTTGTAFPADTVIDLSDVVNEDPTPGYDVLAYTLSPGGGGGGGVSDHGDLTGRSAAGQHPTSAITGLDAALAGKATTAQGAKADTAVQPAALDAYATDAELTAGLATKAATSHAHVVADTTGLQAALDAKQAAGSYAPALGADDNYATDAEKVKLANLSGTNTGDQTLPTWSTIASKPAVVAEGSTQALARTAIGAGTSSLVVGTTAGTATEGNDARIGKIGGTVAVTGTPTAGQVPVASSGTAAAWGTVSGGSDPWTYVVATADTANSTTTAANVSGLTIPVLPDGLYEFQTMLRVQADAATTGVRAGLSWNSSGCQVTARGMGANANNAAIYAYQTTAGSLLATASAINAPAANVPFLSGEFVGTIRAASMAGGVDVTVASEVAASEVKVLTDSFIRYRRIAN